MFPIAYQNIRDAIEHEIFQNLYILKCEGCHTRKNDPNFARVS